MSSKSDVDANPIFLWRASFLQRAHGLFVKIISLLCTADLPHDPAFSEEGNVRALEEAKRNLIRHYAVVGLTERLREFISILELLFPRFFTGAAVHFDSLSENRFHLRSTNGKILPNQKTLDIIRSKEIYRMEREFYDFAVAIFDKQLKELKNTNRIGFLPKQFHYEKIKP